MKAVTVQSKQYSVTEVDKPTVRSDTVLIKTVAVAVNPTDTKTPLNGNAPDGQIIGCDAAGVVEEVGPDATYQFQKGDRVAGFIVGNGVGRNEGAFGEYALIRTGAACKIPENLSFEQGATLGVGIVTMALTLYQSLQLQPPAVEAKDRKPTGKSLLVYGGSTATGILAIQFAKLSGYNVVATSSPRNFDLVKSLGASEVFDYSSETCGADINAYTKNSLHHAMDCIGSDTSAAVCSAAVSSSPSGKIFYCPLLPQKLPNREGQEIGGGFVLGYTAAGETTRYGGKDHEPRLQDYEWGGKFWRLAATLLAKGEIRTHEMDVRTGGLEGVLEGIADVREGRVSGKKLVYKI